jgi:hypothetical protein
MKMSKIGFGTPINENILLYWENSNHFEDGQLFIEDGEIYHCLFDGESLNDSPTHWCYLPEVE